MKTIIVTIGYPANIADDYEFDVPDYATNEEIEKTIMDFLWTYFVNGWKVK